METGRLEAFSDGVLAIIITIMVLELEVPHGHDLAALWRATGTGFLTYVLSFAYVGIYWNNHHHLFQVVQRVTGGVLWANLHLLFWLSLLPFTTGWMDTTGFARVPVMVYGFNLLASALAWWILLGFAIRAEGPNGTLAAAVGSDLKGKASAWLYVAGILSALLVAPGGNSAAWLPMAFFGGVAGMWLIPDRRMEQAIERGDP